MFDKQTTTAAPTSAPEIDPLSSSLVDGSLASATITQIDDARFRNRPETLGDGILRDSVFNLLERIQPTGEEPKSLSPEEVERIVRGYRGTPGIVPGPLPYEVDPKLEPDQAEKAERPSILEGWKDRIEHEVDKVRLGLKIRSLLGEYAELWEKMPDGSALVSSDLTRVTGEVVKAGSSFLETFKGGLDSKAMNLLSDTMDTANALLDYVRRYPEDLADLLPSFAADLAKKVGALSPALIEAMRRAGVELAKEIKADPEASSASEVTEKFKEYAELILRQPPGRCF